MTNQLSNVEPDVSTEGSSHLMNILDWEDLSDGPISGKTFSVVTFGCQMNKHDSERIVGMLTALGATEVKTVEESDIIIFVTCCVRGLWYVQFSELTPPHRAGAFDWRSRS